MDRYTIWEAAGPWGWRPILSYPTRDEARDGLEAWAAEALEETGQVPVLGRDMRLTEDHMPTLRLEPGDPRHGPRPPRVQITVPAKRKMSLPL